MHRLQWRFGSPCDAAPLEFDMLRNMMQVKPPQPMGTRPKVLLRRPKSIREAMPSSQLFLPAAPLLAPVICASL